MCCGSDYAVFRWVDGTRQIYSKLLVFSYVMLVYYNIHIIGRRTQQSIIADNP